MLTTTAIFSRFFLGFLTLFHAFLLGLPEIWGYPRHFFSPIPHPKVSGRFTAGPALLELHELEDAVPDDLNRLPALVFRGKPQGDWKKRWFKHAQTSRPNPDLNRPKCELFKSDLIGVSLFAPCPTNKFAKKSRDSTYLNQHQYRNSWDLCDCSPLTNLDQPEKRVGHSGSSGEHEPLAGGRTVKMCAYHFFGVGTLLGWV